MADTPPPSEVTEIDGALFPTLNKALAEFSKALGETPDPSAYMITILANENSLTVFFKPKNSEQGYRGSSPGMPGFEVEFDSYSLEVVRSNFVR